jgi:hypothetical protein
MSKREMIGGDRRCALAPVAGPRSGELAGEQRMAGGLER